MSNLTTECNEERLAELLESYRLLPEALQRILAAQALNMREYDARQSEAITRIEEKHAATIAANASLRDENATLSREVERLGAENMRLREDVAALRADQEALLKEREATEILVEAFEVYRSSRRAADAAVARPTASTEPMSCVPSEIISVDGPAAQLSEQPIVLEKAPPLDAPTAVQDRIDSEFAEVPTDKGEREEEHVFRLPVTLLDSMDRLIERGDFASRHAFARAAFAEAIEARLPAADEQRALRGATPRSRRKQMATETGPAPG
jgi:Arc/MetJ-type ribon-helix-helix transcriptional regulator